MSSYKEEIAKLKAKRQRRNSTRSESSESERGGVGRHSTKTLSRPASSPALVKKKGIGASFDHPRRSSETMHTPMGIVNEERESEDEREDVSGFRSRRMSKPASNVLHKSRSPSPADISIGRRSPSHLTDMVTHTHNTLRQLCAWNTPFEYITCATV